MTTRGALEAALAKRLGSASEARWMVEEVIPDRATVTPAAEGLLAAMTERRLGGEPLQYVLGTWAFRSLELLVDERALIPRPETEQVVEAALAELRRMGGASPCVVDLGTGTGAIALSIAAEVPAAVVWATDADRDALALAAANRSRVGVALPGVGERVRLRSGSWFDALPPELSGAVDLVVSNPPYVSDDEWEILDAEVRREPRQALVAGAGSDGTPGLADVEAVVLGARRWLRSECALVVELSPVQAAPAAAMARDVGFAGVRIVTDLAGRDRALVARR